MKIIFVRHGATASNKLGRVMSRSNDESLSEEGLAEVINTVSNISSHIKYDIIFTSPLKRASETAFEFGRSKGLSAIASEMLCLNESSVYFLTRHGQR